MELGCVTCARRIKRQNACVCVYVCTRVCVCDGRYCSSGTVPSVFFGVFFNQTRVNGIPRKFKQFFFFFYYIITLILAIPLMFSFHSLQTIVRVLSRKIT